MVLSPLANASKTLHFQSRTRSIVKPAFLLNCTFKMTPRLCSPEQFEPVVNSLSSSEISQQPAFSYISDFMQLYLFTCHQLLQGRKGGGGGCVDGLGDYANIKVYKLLASFLSICSKQSPTRRDFMYNTTHIFQFVAKLPSEDPILYHTDQLNTYSPNIKTNERCIRVKVSNWGKSLHSV